MVVQAPADNNSSASQQSTSAPPTSKQLSTEHAFDNIPNFTMAAITSTALRTFSKQSSQIATRSPVSQSIAYQNARRAFQTSSRKMQDTIVTPKKPIGAFRGSLFGFLMGTVLAGGSLYYYVVDEYKVSNTLLTEDIYSLQAAVQRLEGYVKNLEQEVKSKK